jgi:hypothetical protein
MKQIQSFIPERMFSRFITKPLITIITMVFAVACTKSGTPSSSSSSSSTSNNGGGTALLTKEVIVGWNHLNVEVDSIVFTFQYDANNNLTESQESTTSTDSGTTFTTNLTYNYSYSGNVISAVTGTFMQSAAGPTLNFHATTQINTTFTSSGGKVTGYVQTTNTTGTPFLPLTQITGNDSALFTYDASGNLATYIIYTKDPGIPGYSPFNNESFTFSNGNLTQSVNVIYVAGIAEDTVTTVYQYNSKLSAAPFFIALGVPSGIKNDYTQVTETTAGIVPQTNVNMYSTTYNSANQPTSSTVTVTETPAYSGDLGTEKITYTYQ